MANWFIEAPSSPKISLRTHCALSALVFVALLCVRLYWLFFALANPSFLFEQIPMLNNNDGYYYAEGARDILAGFHQEGDLSPISAPLSILTAAIAFVLPVSLDWLLLVMPAVFGSLIAFPLYFFFITFAPNLAYKPLGAMLAAFFGGIVVSYYNRTMIGYYDTDMLVVVLPLSALYFLLCFAQTYQKSFLCAFFVFAIFSQLWHSGLANLFVAMFALALCWALLARFLRPPFALLPVLVVLCVLFVPFLWLQILLAGALIGCNLSRLCPKVLVALIMCLLAIAAFFGGFDSLFYQFQAYFLQQLPQNSPLVFHNVVGTIREASAISLVELMQRIASSVPLFAVALFGFCMLCVARPIFLFGLPFVLLGFAGAKIGLRFNLFATPFFALGLGYAFVMFLAFLPKARLLLGLPLALLVCVPSLQHITAYQVPTIFNTSEASLLNALKTLAKPTDYLVAWWDYGYGARYYGDVKTFIDGGKHSGAVNYPVSLMLATPNFSASATLAKLTAQTTEAHLGEDDNALVQWLLESSAAPSMRDFLLRLDNGMLEVPPLESDIFYYLPLQIFEIFDVIASFSNIDFKGGIAREESVLYFAPVRNVSGDLIVVDSSLSLNFGEGVALHHNARLPLKAFVRVDEEYLQDDFVQSVPRAQRTDFDMASNLYALWLKTQNVLILCDEVSFYSTALQLFVFGENEAFELVASNPSGRIFKIKK